MQSSEQRRQADARWEAQFGPPVEHGPGAPFSLSAAWLDESVLLTVRAHQDGVAFSDWSLGASLFGFREGKWQQAGDGGPSLPAVRELHRGETVRIRLRVTDDAQRYRALVRVRDERQKDMSVAWVEVQRK